MRAFPVRLPSGVRYWTVLDEDLSVVPVADSFLRQVRFGRDGAESTTRAYAGGIALFLRWCGRTGRTWEAGIEQHRAVHDVAGARGPGVSGAGALGVQFSPIPAALQMFLNMRRTWPAARPVPVLVVNTRPVSC